MAVFFFLDRGGRGGQPELTKGRRGSTDEPFFVRAARKNKE
jgi:hypothetical protein